MKKIIVLALALVATITGFSQLSIGLHGTGNLADARVTNVEDLDFKKKMKAMPGAGVVVQYKFGKNWSVRTGVNYVQNGVNMKATLIEDIGLSVETNNTLHYVQVPANLVYELPVSRLALFVGAGPYVNYGVSGKMKGTVKYIMDDGSETVIKEEFPAFKKEEDGGAGLKRADFGLGAIAGIRLGGGLFVNAGYQLSLSNIADKEDNSSYKNRGLQLTLGYMF